MRTNILKNKYKTVYYVALSCLMLCGISYPQATLVAGNMETEQSRTKVSGNITDENGTPIIGAAIHEKGTSRGTTTDLEGNYSLEISPNATLVISYVGFKTSEIPVGNKSTINLSMKENEELLDEVVVVGYGTQKKATLTGSVSQVSGEDLKKVAAANLTNALSGKTAGVIANTRTGEPGEDDANILIRGMGTMGNTSPLIIVDGIADRSFGRLNPEDVESISVLKDASAAIYGARAANGVILVTTKRGKEGKIKVSYSGNVSFSQPTRTPKMLNSLQYATYVNEYDAPRGSLTYPETALAKIKDGSDPISFPDTDWWGAVSKNWATNTKHSLSVSGGNEKVSFYTSAQYMYQDAIYKTSPQNYNQYQFITNMDAKLNKSIKFSMDILGRQEVRDRGIYSTDDLFGYFLTTSPMAAPYYPNGLLRVGYDGITNNAILMTSDTPGTNNSTYNTLNLKPKLRIDLDLITPGLYTEGYAALDFKFNNGKTVKSPYDIYSYNSTTGEYTNHRDATGAISVDSWTNQSTTTTLNFRLGYERKFNDVHNVSAFAAYEQTNYNYSSLSGYRTNFISSTLPDLDFGGKADSDKDNGGSSDETARQNWFGRLNYGYKDKYLAEFTLRYDGSMNFAPGHRWGLFPSMSAAWVISEENFFAPLSNTINFLKLKGSWGMMGNDRIGAYQYLSMYTFSNTLYAFGTEPTYVPGIYESVTANPLVTWEKAKTWNIGFSSQFLDGKFGLDFDYFGSKRNDILITRNASVPTYSGLSLPSENLGIMKNRGFEIVANYQDRSGDFEWGVTANATHARNEVVYMDEATNVPEWQRRTGHSLGGMVLYKALGIFQTQEQIDATPHLPGTMVGDLIYQNTNGDNSITWDDAVLVDESTTPRWIYGLTLNGSWKGFDLNVFFQAQADAEQLVMPTMNMASDFYEGRWVATNTVEQNANAKWPRAFMKAAAVDNRNSQSSTWWLRDASFIRLKSLEVGYSVQNKFVKRMGVEKMRVYANGNNLFTIDKIKIFDPEMTNGLRGYPIQRTLTVGLNVTF